LEEKKFNKCIVELETWQNKCKESEYHIEQLKLTNDQAKSKLVYRNKSIVQKSNELAKKKLDIAKRLEDLQENYDNKKKQNELELSDAHKRQFELEKQNTLLSIQLQSLKFDID